MYWFWYTSQTDPPPEVTRHEGRGEQQHVANSRLGQSRFALFHGVRHLLFVALEQFEKVDKRIVVHGQFPLEVRRDHADFHALGENFVNPKKRMLFNTLL